MGKVQRNCIKSAIKKSYAFPIFLNPDFGQLHTSQNFSIIVFMPPQGRVEKIKTHNRILSDNKRFNYNRHQCVIRIAAIHSPISA